MSNNFKFSYEKINQAAFTAELNKRGTYYANIVIWTILFSIPIFWLLDYIFLKNDWLELGMARLIIGILSYVVYIASLKRRWNYVFTLVWFIGLNVALQAIICGLVPANHVMPFFLLFAVFMLLLNTIIFWPPQYSFWTCLLSYLIIVLLFSFKDRIDKYTILVNNGGGIYFVISAISCVIMYNRYQIIKRSIAKNVIINEATDRLLEQNEKINDQRYIIEESNRKLKKLSEYRQNAVYMLMHDFRSYTQSIQTHVESLKENSGNLTTEQKEILYSIGTGNEKISYFSEKLADSAENTEAKVDFNQEYFDIGPEIERAAIEIADVAHIKHINMQLHLSPTPINVFLDKLFLNQLLFKLLTNAIKFANTGSVLTLHAHKTADKCLIEIVNIGELIGKKELDQLFNKLQTANKSGHLMENDPEMGFAVAKKLTETMGGKLTYNSDQKSGNYYRIEFNSTH